MKRFASAITIRADAETVWALLTDAKGFPRWNSTVTSIEGEIAEGKALAIKVTAAGDRVLLGLRQQAVEVIDCRVVCDHLLHDDVVGGSVVWSASASSSSP